MHGLELMQVIGWDVAFYRGDEIDRLESSFLTRLAGNAYSGFMFLAIVSAWAPRLARVSDRHQRHCRRRLSRLAAFLSPCLPVRMSPRAILIAAHKAPCAR